MRRLIARSILPAALASLFALGCGKSDAPKTPAAAPPPATASAPDAAPDTAPPPPDPATIALGARLFTEKTCVACHGADGKTSLLPEYPKLAGQTLAYAEQQMRDIKDGTRANGQTAAMKAVMSLVSDEEIPALAAYLASLPYGDPVAVDRKAPGAKLFKTKTCFTCHGKDGMTPLLAEYPLIAGQNAAYALQQMRDIQSGARANGQTAAMKGVMHLVNDDELKILAEHLATMADR